MATSSRRPAQTVNDFLKQYKGLKVAVTGGAGFLGSILVEKLVSFGAEVSIIDSSVNGRISLMQDVDKLAVFEADITENTAVAPIMENKDIVFHAASAISNYEVDADPFIILNTEIIGVLNVLSLAAKNHIKRVMLASSSAVYSRMQKNASENGEFHARLVPALAKMVAEEYCNAFYTKYGLEYTILRYFNVYGPGQNDRSIISRFVREIFDHKPFFNPDGEWQTGDFIYIDDAVNMTLIAALKEETKQQTLDIGTGISTSVIELASIVTHAFKKDQAINLEYEDFEEMPSTQNETRLPTADISKTRKLLQYKPQVTLEAGIKKYIDWYKNENIQDLELS